MPDIFITHTEHESDFAEKVTNKISTYGYKVQTSRIQTLQSVKEHIKHAHYFIPIISKNFLKSDELIEQCLYAIELHKCILPFQTIDYDDLDWGIIPPQISRLRWYNFIDDSQFDDTLDYLEGYFHQHNSYLKTFTRYLNSAILWTQFGFQTRHLLSHTEVEQACKWLAKSIHTVQGVNFEPTELMCAYICESRRNIENETTDVFITHTDLKQVENEVVFALQKRGVTCLSRLQAHHKDISIDKAIENAAICVVISCESEDAKELMESEIRYASILNKYILRFGDLSNEFQYPKLTLESMEFGVLPNCDTEVSQYLRYHAKILQRARIWQEGNQSKQGLLYDHNLTLATNWLKKGLSNPNNKTKPLGIHEEYIEESNLYAPSFTPEVFIANAANDLPFAKKLNAELQRKGKVTYWPFERLTFDKNAEEVIYHGITSSDLFVIILSTHTIKRGAYQQEIKYANRLHKKIIGVLIEEIDEADFPNYLKGINTYYFIEEERAFGGSMGDLLSRLESHQDYEKEFHKIDQWAISWVKHDKSVDFLIPDNEIDGVEKWYHQAIATNRKPSPTELHQEYIEISRSHATLLAHEEHKKLVRFRIALAVAGVMLMVSLVLLFNTLYQKKEIQYLFTEAEEARGRAEEQEQKLAVQLEENKLLVDSLQNLDQFARLQEHQRDSIIQRFLYARNYQQNLEEEKEVLSQENQFYKGDIEIAELMRDLREKYKQDKNDQTVLNAYYDIVMSRRFNPGHKAPIYQVTPTPDSKYLLTAGGDGKARLLNIAENKVKSFLQNRYNGAVYSAIFSKNGKYILTASHDGSAILWDIVKATPLSKFKCGGDVKHATFSPNGKWIATSEKEGKATIWEMRSSKKLKVLEHKKPVNMSAFSADSKYLFTACNDGKLRKWRLSDGREDVIATFPSAINSVVLSPNKKELLISTGNRALRLNLSGQTLVRFKGHSDAVLFASYSPKQTKIVTTSVDRTARVWDSNGNLICILGRNREHLGRITSASFSSDGEKVFTSSTDQTVRMWFLSPKEVFEGDNLEKYLEIGRE